jgi:hypothetical protein
MRRPQALQAAPINDSHAHRPDPPIQASRLPSGGSDDTSLLYKASSLHHELYYFSFLFPKTLDEWLMSGQKHVATETVCLIDSNSYLSF